MIVVMKQGASERQVASVIEHIEALGLKSHVIVGTELTVVAALGEYGLASMIGALTTTVANVEQSIRQNPTPAYVIGALVVLVWFVFLKRN